MSLKIEPKKILTYAITMLMSGEKNEQPRRITYND